MNNEVFVCVCGMLFNPRREHSGKYVGRICRRYCSKKCAINEAGRRRRERDAKLARQAKDKLWKKLGQETMELPL